MISSGTAVTATPSTRTPEPWPVSQPSAPTRSASRGAPWERGVGEEPARDGRARGRRPAARPAARPPPSDPDQQQRSASSRVGLRWCGTASRGREQRSHGPLIFAPLRGRSALPRRCASALTRLVQWSGHDPSGRVRRVLQGRPGPAAAPDLRPHRRPAGRPVRRPRLVHRHLAPLAQGEPDARPGGVGQAPRLVAGAAPSHRAALAPRQEPGARREGDVRRPRKALARPAQDAAAPPPDPARPSPRPPASWASRSARPSGSWRSPPSGSPARGTSARRRCRRCSSRCAPGSRTRGGRGPRSCGVPGPPGGVPTRSSAPSWRWPRCSPPAASSAGRPSRGSATRSATIPTRRRPGPPPPRRPSPTTGC